MYGEESKDPKRIIPRATMISVLGVGIFYVFVSWMAIAGTGPAAAPSSWRRTRTPRRRSSSARCASTYGEWAITLFNILLVTGSFACGMAFHNCASRYLYALGREGLSEGLQKTLGATHHKHGSPYIASFVQSGIALVLILAFFVAGMDPYVHMYTLLAILGTMAILIVQSLCAFSVIAYFHFHKNHPSSAHWFKTFLAPLLGGIGMLYVVYLLWEHKDVGRGRGVGHVAVQADTMDRGRTVRPRRGDGAVLQVPRPAALRADRPDRVRRQRDSRLVRERSLHVATSWAGSGF